MGFFVLEEKIFCELCNKNLEVPSIRHYFVYMKATERKIKTYKATDETYYKAQSVMEEKGTPLSTFLEKVVTAIAEGRKVIIHKAKK